MEDARIRMTPSASTSDILALRQIHEEVPATRLGDRSSRALAREFISGRCSSASSAFSMFPRLRPRLALFLGLWSCVTPSDRLSSPSAIEPQLWAEDRARKRIFKADSRPPQIS